MVLVQTPMPLQRSTADDLYITDTQSHLSEKKKNGPNWDILIIVFSNTEMNASHLHSHKMLTDGFMSFSRIN